MFHSIITSYRNRPYCLKLFLESLNFSFKYAKKDHEIIIVDLGSKSDKIINNFDLPIKRILVDYNGPFWKTKAINCGVKHSDAYLVSMVDVDSIIMPQWLKMIENYFICTKKTKLCHRVRFLDAYSKVLKKGITENILNDIVKNGDCYRLARERYGEKAIILQNVSPHIITKDMYENKALGNSHFTIFRDDYLEIGGYDERFVGHGLEDMDFNLRCFKHLKHGSIKKDIKYNIFHVAHPYEKDWLNNKHRVKNRVFYHKNKNQGTVKATAVGEWGEF